MRKRDLDQRHEILLILLAMFERDPDVECLCVSSSIDIATVGDKGRRGQGYARLKERQYTHCGEDKDRVLLYTDFSLTTRWMREEAMCER